MSEETGKNDNTVTGIETLKLSLSVYLFSST